nr:hypothetical protein [Cylindrospermopsis raciborskii]
MQHKFNRDGGSSVIRKYAFISQQLYSTGNFYLREQGTGNEE